MTLTEKEKEFIELAIQDTRTMNEYKDKLPTFDRLLELWQILFVWASTHKGLDAPNDDMTESQKVYYQLGYEWAMLRVSIALATSMAHGLPIDLLDYADKINEYKQQQTED